MLPVALLLCNFAKKINMKRFLSILTVFILTCGISLAQNYALRTWTAGKAVTMAEVKEFGIDRCFKATEIPDNVFARMKGKTFKSYCTVKRTDLRYVKVLHYNIEKEIRIGEIVCHKDIANDLVDIFHKLFLAKYPIERIVLIDNYGAADKPSMNANNTSCFNFRFVAGTKVPSNHSWGKAIDINPLYNPYVKKRKNGTTMVNPEKGRKYANRSNNFAYKINKGDLLYKEFTNHGFAWGGNWKSLKDYQHFEKK